MTFQWQGFLNGLLGLIDGLIHLYLIVILVRVVASWIGADPYNPIMRILSSLTDPFFQAIRRRLPRGMYMTGLDFSPLVAMVLLLVLSMFIANLHF